MSISNAQHRAAKKRPYRLKARAEKQEQTRRRIVDATVELHSKLGPARTTIAQIAERAGVQRHTFYAHFPDERSLFMACSGQALDHDPLPDVERWQDVSPGQERLQFGLAQLYQWFDRNADLAACVLRDAEHHDLTREIVEIRMAPTFDRGARILGEGLDEPSRAILAVGMLFQTWRSLSADYDPVEAAALMASAVCSVRLANTAPGEQMGRDKGD